MWKTPWQHSHLGVTGLVDTILDPINPNHIQTRTSHEMRPVTFVDWHSLNLLGSFLVTIIGYGFWCITQIDHQCPVLLSSGGSNIANLVAQEQS